jgi:hypothetical protein
MTFTPSYVEAALEGEARKVASTPAGAGKRNEVLNSAAFNLGGLVGAGALEETQATERLMSAATENGYTKDHGVKATSAVIVDGLRAGAQHPRNDPAPHRIAEKEKKKPYFVAGDTDGPPKWGDELRRHTYSRNGISVRCKVKRASGGFVDWYRVDGGWQTQKPDGFVDVPYTGAVNPFDDELIGDVLCWPEGERDVESLDKLGLLAFTFGGTGGGLPRAAADLVRGRDVVIFADNDPSGAKHAQEKAALIRDVAARVRVVEFPELPPKGDVSDYIEGGATAEDLHARVDATDTWLPQPSATNNAPPSWRDRTVTASALCAMEFPEIRYIVPGLIPEGLSILAGRPKVGKSWAALDVAMAVADGSTYCLGDRKPVHGDVLYCAMEDNPRRLKSRIRKILGGRDSKPPERLTLATSWRRFNDGGVDDAKGWAAEAKNPVLVIFDTLAGVRPAQQMPNESLYAGDYRALADVHHWANELGIAVIVLHHTRKMEADDPLDSVSGSLGLTGCADTTLIFSRNSQGTILYLRGRDIEEAEHAVMFNRDTCRWTIMGDAAEIRRSDSRQAILQVLTDADETMTPGEIATATSLQRNNVDQLLFKMVTDGEALKASRGHYVHAKRQDLIPPKNPKNLRSAQHG